MISIGTRRIPLLFTSPLAIAVLIEELEQCSNHCFIIFCIVLHDGRDYIMPN